MHRSGTSLLARYISELGYSVGANVMPASYDNPQGFFENDLVVALNDKVLGKCRSKWDLPVLSIGQLERPVIKQYFIEQFSIILNTEFSNEKKIIIKDPRICLLLPLYLSFFKDDPRYNLSILWIIRNPESVSQSLYKRNKFNRYKSQYLYARYNIDVKQSLLSQDHLFIDYEKMLKYPEDTSNRIKGFLNLESLEEPVLKDMLFEPANNNVVVRSEESNRDISNRIYYLLTSDKGSRVLTKELEKLLEDINKETRIVDSWTQRKYHSKLIAIGLNGNKEELVNFIANNGWNVIQWNRSDDRSLSEVEFIPFNKIGTYQFTDVLVNEEEVRWSTSGMIKKEDSYHSSSIYAKLILSSDVEIESIYIRYFAETFELDKVDYQSLAQEKSDLEKLKSDFDELLSRSNEEKRELELQLDGKSADYEYLLGSIDERKNDLLSYQQNLQKTFEEYHEKLQSYENGLGEISKLDNNLKLLIDKVEEYGAENQKLKKIIKLEADESVRVFSKELLLLKEQLVKSESSVEQLRVAKKNMEELSKANDELLSSVDQLKNEKKDALHIVEKQHNEILDFKEAYQNREKNLHDISNSLSYKIGRLMTWPIRMIYEFGKNLAIIFGLFLGGMTLFLRNPGKSMSLFNLENLKTLIRAIREEPYERILSNFRKKLGLKTDLVKSSPLKATEAMNGKELPRRKKVLYISPNLPDFDQSSGGRRAVKLLSLISSFSDITAFTLGARTPKYRDHLISNGVSVIDSRNYNDVFMALPEIDVIIFAWFYTLHDNSAIFKKYPNALKIVDTVDVHWVREERSLAEGDDLIAEDVQLNKKVELDSYRLADVIWAVTENDKKAILNQLPEAHVSIVSNIHDVYERPFSKVETKNILFFGGYNHPPNLRAVDILINDIRPKVIRSIPDVRFVIAGANAPARIQDYGELDNVDFLGFIPEEEITDLYKKSFMAVVPLVAGAGIKGKICEAISYGIPVLTTDIGNEGINLVDGKEGFVSLVGDMAERIISIISSDMDLGPLVEASKLKLDKLVGPEKARLQMYQDINPTVTICIVTWNRLDLLEKCLNAIFSYTDYPFYRVVVHSNGCTDGTQEYLVKKAAQEERLIPRLSDSNDVFVRPNNEMMLEYPESDVLLLNNDTEVTKGWLGALRKAAYSSDQVGIAGSKLLFPDGKLQEFGSELYPDGTGRNIGKWEDPELPEYNEMKRVGYVSGCSMYIKRTTINRIGVFDDQFHPCYCEDSDYAYTAWESGLETVVTPESVVFHYEGGTSGTDENTGFKSYQKENFAKFLSKHQQNLERLADHIRVVNERYT